VCRSPVHTTCPVWCRSMGTSELHLFGHITKRVAGQRFARDVDVKQARHRQPRQLKHCFLCWDGSLGAAVGPMQKWRSGVYHLLPV